MKKFLQKNSFYVILLSCIVIVAIAAMVMVNNNINKLAKKELLPKNAAENQVGSSVNKSDSDIIIGDINKDLKGSTAQENTQKSEQKVQPQAQKSDKENQTNQGEKTVQNQVSASAGTSEKPVKSVAAPVVDARPVASTVVASMIMPAEGTISMDYAMSNLIYSKTLDEWRTHNGIDVAAKAETPVKAAMSGIVEKVYKDLKLGNTVVIRHSGGYETKYSSLAEDIKVKEGQTVNQGDVIGYVGQSASFEIADGTHVHFEVLKDGKNVNPHDYIKK